MSIPQSPWPALAPARRFLRQLAGFDPPESGSARPTLLAPWLVYHELGPLAHFRFKGVWPELAEALRSDGLAAAAENRIHLAALERALAALAPAGIPAVVFKGAAVLHHYEEPGLRTMSDVDFWIQPEQCAAAISCLLADGFQPQFPHKPARLSHSGKLKLIHPKLPASGLELHAYPYTGYWLRGAATVEQEPIWERRQPLQIGSCATAQPEATDLFLHAAFHLAVNHQFDRTTFRGLLDLAVLSRRHPPDLEQLEARTSTWSLNTALWAPLWLLTQLFGVTDLAALAPRLAPTGPRRRLLRRWLAPQMVLAGQQLDSALKRRLYLLLLSDRPGRLPRLLIPSS